MNATLLSWFNIANSWLAKTMFSVMMAITGAILVTVLIHWPINNIGSMQLIGVILLTLMYPGAIFALTQVWKQARNERFGIAYMLLLVAAVAYMFWYHAGPKTFQLLLNSLN